MRVRVFRREGNNQYYFQFLRDDGQVILNSEGYTTEAARDNGVQSVINNSGNADRYEARTNDAGGSYFILKAGNKSIFPETLIKAPVFLISLTVF